MSPKIGRQGLAELLSTAHKLFQEEVISSKKTYKRFTNDYLNSIKHHDNEDAWSKNGHEQNYNIVLTLLTEHEGLVRDYLSRPTLTAEEVEQLIVEFYRFDLPKETVASLSSGIQSEPTPIGILSVTIPSTKKHVDLIVHIANEVNLFKEQIDENDAKALMGEVKIRSLSSSNNTRVVLFFDRLASHGILVNTWQVDLAKRQMVRSSSGSKFLEQHDFSSTLYRLKERPPSTKERELLSMIDKIIEKSKEEK